MDWATGYRQLLAVMDSPASEAKLSERQLTSEEASAYASMVERRLQCEPLQYIVGRWDFCDLTLKVRAPCLCPRPETEELVDLAALEVERLLVMRKDATKAVRILDVGAGTGAIGLALAKRFGPSVDVTAIDIDETAVALSNENAQDVLGPLGIAGKYRALLCDASDFTDNALRKGNVEHDFDFDVVVSNPPYIPRADMATLSSDVVEYESDHALCGGEDGLDVVRDIVDRLPEWCSDDGCVCWMEVDTSHPILVGEWLGEKGSGTRKVQFVQGAKDLCGRDRFVKLIISPD
jgi:release factor glutamine methyltransferase